MGDENVGRGQGDPEGTGADGEIRQDLLRGLTQGRLSRRSFVRGAAGMLAIPPLLAALEACGVSGTSNTGWQEGFDWESWWKDQKAGPEFTFANWPLYIDRTKDGSPTLNAFAKKNGVKVNYKPVIQDNASFFSKISPVLSAGDSIGYDLIVISDGWELTQMIGNHWLIPLDHSRLPSFARYASPTVKDPSFDPGNEYTVVWQSGITGIGYDPAKTGREIKSVKDLYDPEFKGRVGMMSDDTELGSNAMLALGIDPVDSTPADWDEAAKLLRKQRDDGIVRQYYDQGYIDALKRGDTIISMAWSGDVYQAQNTGYPNLKFVVPEEGGMFWHDNCMIPYHASNPVSAIEWMDYSYRPEVQAQIADWVWYVSPVPDAKPIVADQLDDPSVANSDLVFPGPDITSRFTEYYTFKGVEDHDQWTSTFDPIIQS